MKRTNPKFDSEDILYQRKLAEELNKLFSFLAKSDIPKKKSLDLKTKIRLKKIAKFLTAYYREINFLKEGLMDIRIKKFAKRKSSDDRSEVESSIFDSINSILVFFESSQRLLISADLNLFEHFSMDIGFAFNFLYSSYATGDFYDHRIPRRKYNYKGIESALLSLGFSKQKMNEIATRLNCIENLTDIFSENLNAYISSDDAKLKIRHLRQTWSTAYMILSLHFLWYGDFYTFISGTSKKGKADALGKLTTAEKSFFRTSL
jgi:hypothetical protein